MCGESFTELVNEIEMERLIRYHETPERFVGFFYGLSDLNCQELLYFPGVCATCQKLEV